MNDHYKTTGFVFKKEDRLESDRVFSVFTKDFGRVEVFGKAIRKITSKLRSGIEIFSLSEIEFIQGRNKKTLTDAVAIKKFNPLSCVPETLQVAYQIGQVLDRVIKGQELDPRIFDVIIDTFEKLHYYPVLVSNNQLIYYYFLWNFMLVLGYGPQLSQCAECGQKLNPYHLYFSNKDGGVICKNCSLVKKDGTKITSDVVKVLRLMLKKDWNTLLKLKMEFSSQNLLKKTSDNYYNYLLSYIS